MFSKVRIFHVVVVAVSLIACARFALASPPVEPPFEGFLITTFCDVEVAGDFVEEDSFVCMTFEGRSQFYSEDKYKN